MPKRVREMARRLSSPTAKLLRNSRLFSLPPPIPQPFDGDGAFESSVGSDTATRAFPTYQAISTPTSSLHRGDWGLKRPLPMRETTRSTAPAMRVFEVDTINSITDFESAGDHVRTLEKWQQLNMPLSFGGRKVGVSQRHLFVSVFNEEEDNTGLSDRMREEGKSKWKYDGPWVGEMTTGDFEEFLKRKVQGAERRFGKFLRKKITEAALAQQTELARAEGRELPDPDDFEISSEEYRVWMKKLREDTSLSSPLSQWIIQFFDMPDLRQEMRNVTMNGQEIVTFLDSNIMSKPRTHPSAGLSYLRSRNFLENHPLLGPRDYHQPVVGRLLSPGVESNKHTKIGVAGVVTDLDRSHSANTTTNAKYGFEHAGGHKLWISPISAHIDPNGRIRLEVHLENIFKAAAYEGGLIDDAEVETSKVERSQPLPTPSMPSLSQQTSPQAKENRSSGELVNIIEPMSR